MARKQNLMKSAIVIQRIWRGVLGKRRLKNKRDLDRAAKEAFDAVDSKSLIAGDVKELAHRIIYAIEEPSTTTFPPDEVLYLLRLTVLVINAARGYLGLADYDFFCSRQYEEVTGEELDWKKAAKVVNRSEAFIRIVRILAYGPGAKPPRLIQLPNSVNNLYLAQANNPRWNIFTFENMGKGSRICVQLFKWLTAIIEVSDRQQQFMSLISSSFPDWLPKMNELQKAARSHEFEIEINKKCLDILNHHRTKRINDVEYIHILDREIKFIRKNANDAKANLRNTIIEIGRLKNDQSTRELIALNTMENRLSESKEELQELTKALQDATRASEQGDRAAKELIQEIKLKLTNQKLKTSELESQKKLLELQVENNKAKRTNEAKLNNSILQRVIISGEARAAYIIAQVDARAMLRASGVKDSSALPSHLLEMYEPLALKEQNSKLEARQKYLEADRERKSFEDYISRNIIESDIKEQKSKSRIAPTEQELEEERLENEQEAKEERRKHMQYIPDAVLYHTPTRPRPFIIALARDLPAVAKKKMYNEIITSMPGTFIYLDSTENYGMNVEAIQKVFDCQKCVIVNVDHGLTRATRDSFLNALDLTLQALVPTPLIALAIGSDKNMHNSLHGSEYGVDKDDLLILRDGRLKVCMELQAKLIRELQTDEMKRLSLAHAHEVVPSSQSLALVMEACFLFVSEEKNYNLPNLSRRPLTWPLTRKILLEPKVIPQKMSSLRRGQADVELLNALNQYFAHPQWPSSHSEERNKDVLLHSFASLLEYFVEIELLCLKGGGVPPQAFTKSSVRGIQNVITVSDHENHMITNKAKPTSKRDGVHWKEASALLLKAALEDLRIIKTVSKIDKEPHMVSLYREGSHIFLEAYDSNSSQTYLAMVSVYDIPSMLVPNGTDKSVLQSASIPNTSMRMYEQLISLLKFQRIKAAGTHELQKILICKRDYSFLQQFVCRIGGHLVLLKCYEAALGELYFSAYLPQYSATINLLVGINERVALIKDTKRNSSDTHELEIAQLEDARPLLPYVVDRIRIFPSLSLYTALYPDVKAIAMRLNGYRRNRAEQGFQLKVRLHGGSGKILFRKVHNVLGVKFLLECRLSTPTKLMTIKAYEPYTRKTLVLHLDSFLRRILLGYDDDDANKWTKALLSKIRIDWRGEHQLVIDRLVTSVVVSVSGKRIVCSAMVVNEESIELILRDPITSDICKCSLDEEKMNTFLALIPNTQAVGGLSAKASQTAKKIIHGMKESHDNQDESLLHRNKSDEHSNIESTLRDKKKLQMLLEKICMYLIPLDASSMKSGFMTSRCPVHLQFKWEDTTSSRGKQFNTSLRKRITIVNSPDVNEKRYQLPVVYMEKELDELALEKAREADLEEEKAAKAAEELSSLLDIISNEEEVETLIEEGTRAVTDTLVQTMEEKTVERIVERENPGRTQDEILKEIEIAEALAAEKLQQQKEEEENRVILEGTWRKALEMGIKTNFREGKVRWQGHIAVKIMETNCWIGSAGIGKFYKFSIYEPNCAQHFEGSIRSKKHLIEVLGLHGQDLLDPNKEKEMLIFICRNRLEVVVNKIGPLGEVNPPDAPPYRIEFLTDRLYAHDKVTPVNAQTDEDESANSQKLLEIGMNIDAFAFINRIKIDLPFYIDNNFRKCSWKEDNAFGS
jgi:hypothetical protein